MRELTLRLMVPLLLLVLAACASRGPALGQLGSDELFVHAMERLEARDWSDAVDAFELFTRTYPTHGRVAEARYRLGQAYMGRGEYVTAALEFNRLALEAPIGPWADDARFQTCRAYYELAPPPPLDQQYTVSAIEHCRALVSSYPDSEYVPEAQALVEELVNRLAQKEYQTAEHYFRRNAFDSAIIYYQIVVDQYPTSDWAPRALLRTYESYQRLGYAAEAEATRARLLEAYPDSPEAKQLSGVAGAPVS